MNSRKPSREEILAAEGRKVPDVIARDLTVLFCGINPGLYSGAVGHHFARPGNRFWPALHLSGFTERLLAPFEERELLKLDCGITNFVERATATADELAASEIIEGRRKLEEKAGRYRPRLIAVLGITAYRTAFDQPKAALGKQEVAIGESRLWVLPNPSGLNAHYRIDDLARLFAEMRATI